MSSFDAQCYTGKGKQIEIISFKTKKRKNLVYICDNVNGNVSGWLITHTTGELPGRHYNRKNKLYVMTHYIDTDEFRENLIGACLVI